MPGESRSVVPIPDKLSLQFPELTDCEKEDSVDIEFVPKHRINDSGYLRYLSINFHNWSKQTIIK